MRRAIARVEGVIEGSYQSLEMEYGDVDVNVNSGSSAQLKSNGVNGNGNENRISAVNGHG